MKGRGKEGQGSKSKAKKEKETAKNKSANMVAKEGVWMAMANILEDEEMGDNKFEDFTISEDEMFFFKEEDGSIEDLTTCLK